MNKASVVIEIKKRFISILKKRGVSFEVKNGVIIIKGENVMLIDEGITTIPPGTVFNNIGNIDLSYNKLRRLDGSIVFNNKGDLNLSYNQIKTLDKSPKFDSVAYLNLAHNDLSSLPEELVFKNTKSVGLAYNKLKSIPKSVRFANEGKVLLSHNDFNAKKVGKSKNEVIVFNGKTEPEIQLGFRRGIEKDTLERIEKDYGVDSDYYIIVKEAFEQFNQ